MILITGATGLVGGHLLWHLLQNTEKVIALKRESSNINVIKAIFSFYSNQPEKYMQQIEWRTADILDADAVDNALDGVRFIYHCAAVVSLGKGHDMLMDTNVEGTKILLDKALSRNIQKFCFVSSIATCGFAGKRKIIDENTSWDQNVNKTLYARSKYNAEQEVWKAIDKGLNAVIVNPGVILGFTENKAGSALIFHQVKKGLMFYTLGGSGYVDVRDVVKVMIQLMTQNVSAERFILVSENKSNKEIITMMAKAFNKPKPSVYIGKGFLLIIGFFAEMLGRLFHFNPLIDRSFARSATNRSYYSSKKIKDTIGYRFIPIEKCINDVCDYVKLLENK